MKIHLLIAFLAYSSRASDFPIGLFNVPSVESASAAADAGFTHIVTSAPDVLGDAVDRLGLKVVGIPVPLGPIPPRSTLKSIAAWYIADEPEVNSQSPETIARIAAKVRLWDPGTPLTLAIGDGRFAGSFAPSVDALMVDWYPVPHLPLESLALHISTAISQVPGKPIWVVVQAMDWRDYPQRDSKKARIGRFPTMIELRFMSYHAIVRGASGVFYFEMQRRSVPGQTLLDYPERWQALRGVVRELRELKPFFETNETASLNAPGLEGRSWRRGGRTLVVFVNPGREDAVLPRQYFDGGWSAIFAPALAIPRAFPEGRLPRNGVAAFVGR